MKERPILFSGPMVRAILEGRKTQTRRVVRPQPPEGHSICPRGDGPGWFVVRTKAVSHYRLETRDLACPYGVPGDRLWVKEAFWKHRETGIVRYADGASDASWKEVGWKKVPSIHMPRAASRLTLEVVAVRVERLQEITLADCAAEGAPPTHPSDNVWDSTETYRTLWESINGKCSWDANPWVWVIEFKKAKEVGQ